MANTIKLTRKDVDTLIGVLGVTKEQFAARAGYSKAHFYKYYKKGIPFLMSQRICKTYKLDDDLILQLRSLHELIYDAVN